jgi:DNA-binding CsgD family transcriptional regulator
VAVVGRDGRLLISNAAFNELRADGIGTLRGRVTLARADMQQRLNALIRDALDGTLRTTGPDTLAIPRPHSLLPLLIRAVPITPERAERHIGPIPARAVLLMVLNPSHRSYPELTSALRALGLTPAQARIALLVGSGQSPKEVAAALQISEGTVRTTIKHLYARLGIDRQVQLARLVSRTIPFSL